MPAGEQRSLAPDAVSVAGSHATMMSDMSIDPVVRRRAEKILGSSRLEVINEER